ncbi:MAG: hypothetical protein ORN55_02115, partial [Chitinophagaceae bacterium]|nr:hypothetical protein [Chitinophagaceae bacterium]
MEKALFSLCLLLAIFTRSNAQYLTIPDTNFVNYLTAHYPSAMVGNMMDTTDVNVVGDTILLVNNHGITDLEGVQYFDGLKYLNCSVTLVSNIPGLPPLLKYFNCGACQLISLPSLPNSIDTFICGSNFLTSLPALPGNLKYLDCSYNNLLSIPIM